MQKINLVYVNNGAYELYWPSFLEDSCATRLIPGHHFIYYFSLVIRKSKKQDKKKTKILEHIPYNIKIQFISEMIQ